MAKQKPAPQEQSADSGKKMGRPKGSGSTFTHAIADEICERLSAGEPLAQICRDEHTPAYRTVYDWADADPDFAANIARAREDGHAAIFADCLNIADENGRDMRFTERGDMVVDNDVIQRSKLRIETRLKLLAKWDPKRYGDKIDLTTGNEKINLVVTIGGNVDE